MTVIFECIKRLFPNSFSDPPIRRKFIQENFSDFTSETGCLTYNEKLKSYAKIWMLCDEKSGTFTVVKITRLTIEIFSSPDMYLLKLTSNRQVIPSIGNLPKNFIHPNKADKETAFECQVNVNTLKPEHKDLITFLFQGLEFEKIPKILKAMLCLNEIDSPEYEIDVKKIEDIFRNKKCSIPKRPFSLKINPYAALLVSLLALTFFLYYKRHAIKNACHYIIYGSH